jgi:hypothetical protein
VRVIPRFSASSKGNTKAKKQVGGSAPSGSEKASAEADVKPKKENGFENTDSLPCDAHRLAKRPPWGGIV